MQIHICTKFTLLSVINETNTNPNPTAGCSRPKLCCTENDKIWRFFCVLPLSSNEFKPATNRIDKYIKPRMKLKMMFNCVQCILTGVYFPQFLADVCHRRLPTVNIQVVFIAKKLLSVRRPDWERSLLSVRAGPDWYRILLSVRPLTCTLLLTYPTQTPLLFSGSRLDRQWFLRLCTRCSGGFGRIYSVAVDKISSLRSQTQSSLWSSKRNTRLDFRLL